MSAIDQRLDALARHWRVEESADLEPGLMEVLIADPRPARCWVFLASVRAEIPSRRAFHAFCRLVALEGPESAGRAEIANARRQSGEHGSREIEIVAETALVDVHHTVGVASTSGIQRVVRETVRRWRVRGIATPVCWTADGRALRRLSPAESDALQRGAPRLEVGEALQCPAVVPADGLLVVAELVAEPWRAWRLEGLTSHPDLSVGVIGYDCVPLTSSETASEAIAKQFPLYLQAIASASRVVAISDAAASEFRGWARMLQGAGATSPQIRTVELAAEIAPPTNEGLARARRALRVRARHPLVLVVGSHEPRKNHLAVLHAAHRLWREGSRFRLVFVGSYSWNSGRFHQEVKAMRRRGRPVSVLSAADDDLLAAAYKLARCTVFPSLHEGFGLPIAESLALGTPVVTSNFGSMRQIIESGGGGLLVDPRNDDSIAEAIRRLLSDDALHEQLSAEALGRAPRTWDAYADDLWDALNGVD